MKIFIAAGHGGGDPGSLGNGTTEAAEVISIIDKTVGYLNGHLPSEIELIVIDHRLELKDEVTTINRQTTDLQKDIAIELHMNNNSGQPGTGIETYYGKETLARTLQNNLVFNLGLRDRGVKDGNWLYFNKFTKPASSLIELGFLNNVSDLKRVREYGAQALAKAIGKAIGITIPEPTEPPPEQEPILSRLAQIMEKLKEIIAILKTPK